MFNRIKSLMLIGLLVIGMVTLLANLDKAPVGQQGPPPEFTGGFAINKKSIHAESLLKKLGNVDKQPTMVEVRLTNITGQAWCINPGGQDGGLGEPFFWDIDLTGIDVVTPGEVRKNGKALSEVIFYNCDLYNGLFCVEYDNGECVDYYFPPGVCVNPNWSVPNPCLEGDWYDEEVVIILAMDVLYLAWWEPYGPNMGFVLADWQAFHAVLAANGVDFVLTECEEGYIPGLDPNIPDVPLDPGDARVWGGCGVGFPMPS